MKEYEVTVEISVNCQSIEVTEVVDAYSEAEALNIAEEKIRDNILINGLSAYCTEEG